MVERFVYYRSGLIGYLPIINSLKEIQNQASLNNILDWLQHIMFFFNLVSNYVIHLCKSTFWIRNSPQGISRCTILELSKLNSWSINWFFTTGCPPKLFPLCFCWFLGFLISYSKSFIYFSTALSMQILKLSLILFLDAF